MIGECSEVKNRGFRKVFVGAHDSNPRGIFPVIDIDGEPRIVNNAGKYVPVYQMLNGRYVLFIPEDGEKLGQTAYTPSRSRREQTH